MRDVMTSPLILTQARGARRPWPRFSLRTFLLASFGLAFAMATLSSLLSDLRREQAVVGQIRAVDGRVAFTSRGYDLLGNVRFVSFESNSPGQARVAAGLCQLQHLEYVELNTAQVTDDMVPHLARIPKLKSLAVGSTQITPAGLRRLRSAPGLTSISLTGQAIDDDLLQAVADLPQLQSVMLYHTRVTNRGLRALDKLPHLRHVHLVDCPDASLAPLNDLAQAP